MAEASDDPIDWLFAALADLESHDLRRRLATHVGPQGAQLEYGGRRLINFGANDYLGLAADPRLAAAVRGALDQSGWGAGASPLITGHAALHEQLEQALADFTGAEAALVFPSGFAANLGTIPALVGREDTIFADEKNHASLIDGCRLSRATIHTYPHRDVASLAALLEAAGDCRRKLIVTDSVFSMDGDLAPLVEIADLAERHGAMLMSDEAHATGVMGSRGRGLAEQLGVERSVHVHVGTLSKALGSAGGFVAGRRELIEWLVNRARPYVFSTASPPAASAAAIAALAIVQAEPWRRVELQARASQLRERLRAAGWQVGDSASQIIPLVIGDASATMRLSAALRDEGYWVPGIRPPSVPPGQSLLRISLSWAHDEAMLDGLVKTLTSLRR